MIRVPIQGYFKPKGKERYGKAVVKWLSRYYKDYQHQQNNGFVYINPDGIVYNNSFKKIGKVKEFNDTTSIALIGVNRVIAWTYVNNYILVGDAEYSERIPLKDGVMTYPSSMEFMQYGFKFTLDGIPHICQNLTFTKKDKR